MYTLWKLRKFSLTQFSQKFRESNVFTKEYTRELISRNISYVRENFLFFHTVDDEIFIPRIFREINSASLEPCEKENLLSRIFGKNFVKVTGLLKKSRAKVLI